MYLLAECDRPRSMPLGFGIPNPGEMAENSPAFQRRDQVMRALSPEGTAEPRCLSRPFGTHSSPHLKPGVENAGLFSFCPFGTSRGSLPSNPSGINRPRSQRLPRGRTRRDLFSRYAISPLLRPSTGALRYTHTN